MMARLTGGAEDVARDIVRQPIGTVKVSHMNVHMNSHFVDQRPECAKHSESDEELGAQGRKAHARADITTSNDNSMGALCQEQTIIICKEKKQSLVPRFRGRQSIADNHSGKPVRTPDASSGRRDTKIRQLPTAGQSASPSASSVGVMGVPRALPWGNTRHAAQLFRQQTTSALLEGSGAQPPTPPRSWSWQFLSMACSPRILGQQANTHPWCPSLERRPLSPGHFRFGGCLADWEEPDISDC